MRLDRRAFLGGTLATSACGVLPRLPGEQVLNSYAASIPAEQRRPLITIPGTLGSRLRMRTTGEFVWGGPRRLSLDPINAKNARLLALPIGKGDERFRDLKDEIRPFGVLRRANAQVLGTSVEEEVYDGLVASLNLGGYEFSRTEEEEAARRGENPGSLEFPYDWRRDIVESARILDDFVERKAQQVARVRKEKNDIDLDPQTLKFDIVAHSMGGLVLRYWMMYGNQDLPEDGTLPELTWAGAKRVACAIFVAPPNLGSINAVTSIIGGRQLGFLQPSYPPALIGTHLSTYQLMPRNRHRRLTVPGIGGLRTADLYTPQLWDELGWGLLDPSQDDVLAALMPDTTSRNQRHARARQYLTKALARAEQFHRAIDRRGTPRGPDMFLVVGTGLDTPAGGVVDTETGEIEPTDQEEGDGIVLRASALSDERQGGNTPESRWRQIRYRTVLLLPGEHVTITHNPVFADNPALLAARSAGGRQPTHLTAHHRLLVADDRARIYAAKVAEDLLQEGQLAPIGGRCLGDQVHHLAILQPIARHIGHSAGLAKRTATTFGRSPRARKGALLRLGVHVIPDGRFERADGRGPSQFAQNGPARVAARGNLFQLIGARRIAMGAHRGLAGRRPDHNRQRHGADPMAHANASWRSVERQGGARHHRNRCRHRNLFQ